MDLGNIIRPVIFTTGYEECGAAFFGSGFLVRSATDFYFITALHVLNNHGKQLSDLRIPAKLGSTEVIPQVSGFKASINKNNSFEDLLVIRLNGAYIKENKLEDQFWTLRHVDGFPNLGQTAVVLGFPEEMQEMDVENNRGSYQSVYIKGKISEVDEKERMYAVATSDSIPIKSFNQLSGSVVFSYEDNNPDSIILAGVVFQGGRSANKVRFFSAHGIFNLINHHESAANALAS